MITGEDQIIHESCASGASDSRPSPNVVEDLEYRLPPPNYTIVAPLGKLPSATFVWLANFPKSAWVVFEMKGWLGRSHMVTIFIVDSDVVFLEASRVLAELAEAIYEE